jgi:hypothetical protein
MQRCVLYWLPYSPDLKLIEQVFSSSPRAMVL